MACYTQRARDISVPPLRTVREYWGEDKLVHYQWAERGARYCKALGHAAIRVRDWEEAVQKLNQLLRRRQHTPRARSIRGQVNPIDLIDLENLARWVQCDTYIKLKDPHSTVLFFERLSIEDLPPGFGFDKYGLMVVSDFAAAPECINRPSRRHVIHSSYRTPAARSSSVQPLLMYYESRDPLAAVCQRSQLSDIQMGLSLPDHLRGAITGLERFVEGPRHMRDDDALYKARVLHQLQRENEYNTVQATWGNFNNLMMSHILGRATEPTGTSTEPLYMTGPHAVSLIESRQPLPGPIITDNQQQFRWKQELGRPIEQMLHLFVKKSRRVSVQIPSLSKEKPSFVTVPFHKVEDRFIANQQSNDSWNCLDMHCPLPPLLYPQCLSGADCQLLTCVRDEVVSGTRAERVSYGAADWRRWKEVELWTLLAEGGAQTLPHTDSNGYSTWITVQEGEFGFGWMSNPTEEQRASWLRDPFNWEIGDYKYVVLRTGQTIFFESGTIHFVFRLSGPNTQTLAVGGHILRWSRITNWMKVLIDQAAYPESTNEDISTTRYCINTVAKLVRERQKQNKVDECGGQENVREFFTLKKELEVRLDELKA